MTSTPSLDDINRHVIEDFRANDGAVDVAMGGFFAGKPVLILHNTGAKTGKQRLNPLVYATHDERYVVAATKGGSPNHPHWFLNVQANPDVTVEVGTEMFPCQGDHRRGRAVPRRVVRQARGDHGPVRRVRDQDRSTYPGDRARTSPLTTFRTYGLDEIAPARIDVRQPAAQRHLYRS